jgi:16S rRNA (cytosine1402-N4)-methyltransferase
MSAGRGEVDPPAGGPARHIPVLLAQCLEALRVREGGVYLDGTFGAGGYSRAILAAGGRVIGVDRDPNAIRAGRTMIDEFPGRLELVEGRFGDLDLFASRLGVETLDGVALDIGVSSMQIDQAERGFSLRFEAPLDMRMEGQGRSAADILLEDDEETLANIFFHFGEERAARRIARAIVVDRESEPYVSTLQLARMISRVAPQRPGELTHPATKVFQALRIAVNDELGQLLRGLAAAERALAPGGRLVVVTFHSLEDRIVKQFLARRSGKGRAASRLLPGEPAPTPPSFVVPSGQPILPTRGELAANSRARPAKLRFGARTSAAPIEIEPDIAALTLLPASRGRRS